MSNRADDAHALLDLHRSVPALITLISNRITATGTATFGARHGLGSTDWKVLSSIAIEPGISGAGIAQLVGMDKALVSRVLKKFLIDGLIRIRQSTRHSNYQEITLTSKGWRLHDAAVETAFQREAALLEGFSLEERRSIVGLLVRLLEQTAALNEL